MYRTHQEEEEEKWTMVAKRKCHFHFFLDIGRRLCSISSRVVDVGRMGSPLTNVVFFFFFSSPVSLNRRRMRETFDYSGHVHTFVFVMHVFFLPLSLSLPHSIHFFCTSRQAVSSVQYIDCIRLI
jgi:hypothetical protein